MAGKTRDKPLADASVTRSDLASGPHFVSNGRVMRYFPILLLATLSAATAQEPAPRPNVLWITCEDMSSHLGCYGDLFAHTPSLDRLAKEGTRYTRAFATIGVCAPARSSIITGMYPPSIGTHHMRCRGRLPADIRCFTEHLRDAGWYCTNDAKTDYNFTHPKTAWDKSARGARWRDRPNGSPFFAVVNINVTHESKVRAPDNQFDRITRELRPFQRRKLQTAPVPPFHPNVPEVRRDWARYCELITAMDRNVARILKQLEDDGLADDTIVCFYSDHGAGLPRCKRWLYDSSLQVPLIVRIPERFSSWRPTPPGGSTDRLVSFVDLGPTVLSLCGIEVPSRMHGVPFLGPGNGKPRRYVHAFRNRMDERWDMMRAVRDSRFKYIRNYHPHRPWAQWTAYAEEMPTLKAWRRLAGEGRLVGPQKIFMAAKKPREELYDTLADPSEIHNLSNDPDYAPVKRRLHEEMVRWMKDIRDLGFLPEEEMRLGIDGPEYTAVRKSIDLLPMDDLMAAADLVGQGKDAAPRMLALLDAAHPALRWWGLTALEALGEQAKNHADRVAARLDDPSVAVQLAAAAALHSLGAPQRGLHVIASGLRHEHERVRLRAAGIADRMDGAAAPLRQLLEERKREDTRDVKKVLTKALADLRALGG